MSDTEITFKRIVLPFEVEVTDAKNASDADKGTIRGYGAAYENVDQGDDVIKMGTFSDDLAAHEKSGEVPHMFFNHNINEPVGDWLSMKDVKKGLDMNGKLWIGQGIQKAEQAYNLCKGKGPKGLSVGIMIPKGGIELNAKTGVRTITKARLKEVSVVPYPMNLKAQITSVKSALADRDHLTIRDAEELLRDVALFSADDAKTFLARLRKGMDLQRDAELKSLEAVTAFKNAILNTTKALRG